MRKPTAKHRWLDWAEIFDSFRVVPRLFLLACFIWTVHTTYMLLVWYLGLPDGSRGLEASGFGAIVFGAQITFLKLVYTTYSQNGRDWNAVPTQVTSTSSQSTTVTGPVVEPEK